MTSKNEMKVLTSDGVMKINVMDITPKRAAELLNKNVNNRSLRMKRVALYKSEMLNNNWKSNGIPIIIGNDGELKDGQHRLKACIDANKTMKDVVVINLPKAQANCYDIGAQRSAKDIAKFEGLDETPFFRNLNMFAAVNIAIAGNAWTRSYSKINLIQEMQKHYDACEFVYNKIFCSVSSRNKAKTRKSSIGAAIFNAYISGYDREKLERFCEVLTYGIVKEDTEQPIIMLRDNILSAQEYTKKERTKMYLQCQAVLKAFENNDTKVDLRKANTEYYSYPK